MSGGPMFEEPVMNQILPGLFLGSQGAEQGPISRLKDCSITHVLQVGLPQSLRYTHEKELVYKRVIVGDDYFEDNVGRLIEAGAFDFISEGRQKGGVLVHCQLGFSRSATAVIAYLMLRVQKTPNLPEALTEVIKCRPRVQPNNGFCRQLKVLETCRHDLAKYDRKDAGSFLRQFKDYVQFYAEARARAGVGSTFDPWNWKFVQG